MAVLPYYIHILAYFMSIVVYFKPLLEHFCILMPILVYSMPILDYFASVGLFGEHLGFSAQIWHIWYLFGPIYRMLA
jgi:hypothetical protein